MGDLHVQMPLYTPYGILYMEYMETTPHTYMYIYMYIVTHKIFVLWSSILFQLYDNSIDVFSDFKSNVFLLSDAFWLQ